MLRRSWACRCLAPPGFAGCAPCRLCRHGHSAPIPHAFAPAALRTMFASRGKPCGLSPPRRAWRPLIPPTRLRRIGPASAPPCGQRAGEHAGACCGRLCGCVPSSTLAVPAHHVSKDGLRTTRTASLWSFHATPQDRRRRARRRRSCLSLGGCPGPRQGASQCSLRAGCRVCPVSFRRGGGSAQGVLVFL